MAPSRIVVVGASAAGLAVAEGLRRLGHTGDLTMVGAEAHPPYDRPPLSKQVLTGEWPMERARLREPAALDGLGARWLTGCPASGLDAEGREVLLADGTRIPYDALVVATGLTARKLPGAEGVAGAYVLRTAEDALALREALGGRPRLVVVGAGFVGCEVAAVASATAASVTLLSATGTPLAAALGEPVGAALAAVHRAHGVRLVAGRAVGVRSRGGRATGVALDDGRELAADAVLMAIGAEPAVGWLAGSGVPLDDGVVCDATLHAGRGVWAAGDAARFPEAGTGRLIRVEHRTHAAESGLAVARNILAGPSAAAPYTPIPYVWSDQYDLRLQAYGRTRGADRVRVVDGAGGRGDADAHGLIALYGAGDRVCGVVGVNQPRRTRGYRALVAAGTPWREAVAGAVGQLAH
jgi:3-phenylpropionate/trans-cinnamate dioxygenase ferredoxin reductase subunit